MKFEFPLPPNQSLNSFLKKKFPFLRYSAIQKLWRKQEIKINGKPVSVKTPIPQAGLLTVFLPAPRPNFFALTGTEILAETENLLVFAKKAGQAVHAGVGIQGSDLKNAAETLLQLRLITVHRLDRATSGVIVFAKNARTARQLEAEFRQQKVHKKYLAVVSPPPAKNAGAINFPLQKSGFKIVGQKTGKPACTIFRVLKKSAGRALLEVTPQTGRTHQIRVHLKEIGCPVLGDQIYGGQPNSRLLLHAVELGIAGQTWQTKIPPEFTIKSNA